MRRNDLGGSIYAKNLELAQKSIYRTDVKLGPNHSSHCTDSNSVNDTQIRVCMSNLLQFKY